MNELKIFENSEFGQVRTIEENSKILFCGSDIAKALGYAKPQNAISAHCKGALKRGIGVQTGLKADGTPSTQILEMLFIPEGDVYRLIVNSKLPTAEKFERWVFDEVLPTIRKTGGYVSNDDMFIATYMPNVDEQTKALFKSTLATVKSLNAKIEQDKPKVLFADAVSASKTSILVGDLAKLLKQNGYDIGQKRLFELLRQQGYLIKNGSSQNMPTQKAMDKGLFEVKETTITNPDGSIRVTKTTKVKSKGQIYFINKFLSEKAVQK